MALQPDTEIIYLPTMLSTLTVEVGIESENVIWTVVVAMMS